MIARGIAYPFIPAALEDPAEGGFVEDIECFTPNGHSVFCYLNSFGKMYVENKILEAANDKDYFC